MLTQFNQSIWGDEGFSAILSMKSIPEIIKIITRDTSPPLYNVTEHLWFQAFGTSEVAIRSLSFLYYLIAVLFTYLIATHLWNRRTAILAAALTFLNPFFFIYAFEGRMYSILAAGVVASMYFFIRRKWVPYALATAWALYSHHFSIFILFVQGLLFLYELLFGKKKDAGGMFLGFLGTIALYVPWIIPLYKQTTMVGGGFWLGTPTPNDLKKLLYDYLAEGIPHQLARPALILVLSTLALRKWHKNIKISATLLLWFLVPILATWGISQVFQSVFFNRYLLYTIPAAMLLLASQRRGFSISIIILIIGFFAVIDFHYFTHPTKKPFAQFAQVVKEQTRGDDFLIQTDPGNHYLWETKYYGIPVPIYVSGDNELPFFVGTALMEQDDIIREIPKGINRVGVITNNNVEGVSLPGYTKNSNEISVGELKLIWYD